MTCLFEYILFPYTVSFYFFSYFTLLNMYLYIFLDVYFFLHLFKGKVLLVHLLTVVADHRDHLGVARVLLNKKTTQLGYGLMPHNPFVHNKRFTEEPPQENPPSLVAAPPGFDTPSEATVHPSGNISISVVLTEKDSLLNSEGEKFPASEKMVTLDDLGGREENSQDGNAVTSTPQELPQIVTNDETADTVSTSSAGNAELTTTDDLQFNIKSLIDFIISR